MAVRLVLSQNFLYLNRLGLHTVPPESVPRLFCICKIYL